MPCQIIAFKIIPLFIITFVLFFLYKIVLSGRIVSQIYGLYIIGLTLICGITMYFGSLPDGWKESSTNQIVLYLTVTVVFFLRFSNKEIEELIKGIRMGLFINIIWSFVQFTLYLLIKFDINDFVFSKVLPMREKASTFNTSLSTMCVTGINWHPAQLVPIIILAYFFFDDILIRCLLIFLAVISTNTTCVVALALCFVLDFIRNIGQKKKKRNLRYLKIKNFLIVLTLIIVVVFIVIAKGNIIIYFINHISRVIERINSAYTGVNVNNSTMLHLRYYTSYPLILSHYGLKEALFGIGFECSGYPFTELYGQYEGLKSWHVESDLINFLVGRGLIWTVSHYAFLFMIAIKGRKISFKYTMTILVLIGSGILYNNNFLWIEFLIYVFFIAINKNYNIFNSVIKNMETSSICRYEGNDDKYRYNICGRHRKPNA